MTWREWIIIGAKLAGCASLVFAMAMGMVIFSEDGQVTSAEADVTHLVPEALIPKPDFEDIITSSGLEPRPYDHNGNRVHFAAGDTDYEPRQVLDYFQTKFVDADINSRTWEQGVYFDAPNRQAAQAQMASQDQRDQRHAMLNGEVVPVYVSDDHVAMGGIDPTLKSEDAEEMADQWPTDPDTGHKDFHANIDGFRYVEARRDELTGQTTVTASWSGDDDFDADRAENPESEGVGTDSEVPVCRGCEPVNRFAGLASSEPYTLNQYRTRNDVGDVHEFYAQAMPARGWQPAESAASLERLQQVVPQLNGLPGDLEVYERDGEFVTIFADRSQTPETSVIALRGPNQAALH